MIPDRVILIGFMGSGKTTVGRILAERLAWEFVDMDAWLEARAGMPVAEIFRDRGEQAFREMEKQLLASLRGRKGIVVATGGGAPAQPGNREFFSSRDAVFHLRVSFQTTRERTGENKQRPLLSLGEGALRSLYESRLTVYEELGRAVQTDNRTPAEVAEEILLLLKSPIREEKPGDSA